MHRYFVLIKSFSLSVGYSLKGEEQINPRGLVEKAVKESQFHFSMIFYVQKIKNFPNIKFQNIIFSKINNTFSWPWWPSGLIGHVSNSSRDRLGRPRFESHLRHVFYGTVMDPLYSLSMDHGTDCPQLETPIQVVKRRGCPQEKGRRS